MAIYSEESGVLAIEALVEWSQSFDAYSHAEVHGIGVNGGNGVIEPCAFDCLLYFIGETF